MINCSLLNIVLKGKRGKKTSREKKPLTIFIMILVVLHYISLCNSNKLFDRNSPLKFFKL
jgi:hypothetical protein